MQSDKLSRIVLDAEKDRGYIHGDNVTKKAADITSRLLTQNHELFHAYFHIVGMHNHELHHLLAIYSLGATESEIQAAWDRNAKYQKVKSAYTSASDTNGQSSDLSFTQRLGKPEYYSYYLQFFKDEIANHGVVETLQKFMFDGTPEAEDFFARMHSGLLHPIIHLGYGLEFNQPLIVAEALADAAIHNDFMGTICFPAEKVSATRKDVRGHTMVSLAEDLHNNDRIIAAISEEATHNKLATDLMVREPDLLIDIVSQWTVNSTNLESKLAEMIQTSSYLLACSQRPDKAVAFDFYMMHSANLSVFYPTFLAQTWISDRDKCRLLEWKGRLDLAVYASCKSPSLHPDRIQQYKPAQPGEWNSLFSRACRYGDDGHTAKLIRSLKLAEVSQEQFPNVLPHRIKAEDRFFLQAAHMVMDCVERMDDPNYKRPDVQYFPGTDEEVLRIVARWIRFCGTDVAWQDVDSIPVEVA